MDERLRLFVVVHRYTQIRITREAGFRTRGHGKSPDDRESSTLLLKTPDDPPKHGFEVAHGFRAAMPRASPQGAPGREWSQVFRRCSIARSSASWCSRRRRARMRDTPAPCRSSAIRSLRATSAVGAGFTGAFYLGRLVVDGAGTRDEGVLDFPIGPAARGSDPRAWPDGSPFCWLGRGAAFKFNAARAAAASIRRASSQAKERQQLPLPMREAVYCRNPEVGEPTGYQRGTSPLLRQLPKLNAVSSNPIGHSTLLVARCSSMQPAAGRWHQPVQAGGQAGCSGGTADRRQLEPDVQKVVNAARVSASAPRWDGSRRPSSPGRCRRRS